MGIQADLILFHPYDRWGYSRMNLEQQNFYLRYVVNRFSAYHNVWWAMANEFDLFRWKPVSEWESNAETVCRQDPYRHLRSIHNCMTMYGSFQGMDYALQSAENRSVPYRRKCGNLAPAVWKTVRTR